MRKFSVVATATLCAALLAGCETIETLDLSKVGSDLSNFGSEVSDFGSRVAGGFGSGLGVDKASKVEPRGSEFSKNLYSGYLDLARAEFAEGDYGDSDRFADYAINVAAGATQEPEEVSSRKIPQSAVGDLTAARARLMGNLANGARTKAPAQAAKAQVMFDCWMQEQEENFQPKDIARCRTGFNTAMAALGSAPVAARPGRKYVVYFPFNSAKITPASMRLVEQVIDDAKATRGARIRLVGHTDLAGNSAYNERLSGKRVIAVADALKKGGISGEAVNSRSIGEGSPAIKTKDGIANARNRRVEVEIVN